MPTGPGWTQIADEEEFEEEKRLRKAFCLQQKGTWDDRPEKDPVTNEVCFSCMLNGEEYDFESADYTEWYKAQSKKHFGKASSSAASSSLASSSSGHKERRAVIEEAKSMILRFNERILPEQIRHAQHKIHEYGVTAATQASRTEAMQSIDTIQHEFILPIVDERKEFIDIDRVRAKVKEQEKLLIEAMKRICHSYHESVRGNASSKGKEKAAEKADDSDSDVELLEVRPPLKKQNTTEKKGGRRKHKNSKKNWFFNIF